MTDWRIQGQERFLYGVSLLRKQYQNYSDHWQHDHCEFCGEKFSEQPNNLNVGYVTMNNYHWICENCFKDFNQLFQWKYDGNTTP